MLNSSDSINHSNDITILIKKLEDIVSTGIQVDKNLRQPSFYNSVTIDELKVECFAIICDLLTGQ